MQHRSNLSQTYAVTAPYDINAQFNNAVDWYYGTVRLFPFLSITHPPDSQDGNTPSNQYDFASVVMHEFLHGLGFSGRISASGTTVRDLHTSRSESDRASQATNGNSPSSARASWYDRQIINGAGQNITNFLTNGAALYSVVREPLVWLCTDPLAEVTHWGELSVICVV